MAAGSRFYVAPDSRSNGSSSSKSPWVPRGTSTTPTGTRGGAGAGQGGRFGSCANASPDDRIFGKPSGRDDAARMLRELSGRTHTVVSGLCLLGLGEELVAHELTDVTFRLLTPGLVDTYLASGEWEGRAGAYAIQGLGGRLVERIEGDYLNVVGLPGALLVSLLERNAPNLLQTRR